MRRSHTHSTLCRHWQFHVSPNNSLWRISSRKSDKLWIGRVVCHIAYCIITMLCVTKTTELHKCSSIKLTQIVKRSQIYTLELQMQFNEWYKSLLKTWSFPMYFLVNQMNATHMLIMCCTVLLYIWKCYDVSNTLTPWPAFFQFITLCYIQFYLLDSFAMFGMLCAKTRPTIRITKSYVVNYERIRWLKNLFFFI